MEIRPDKVPVLRLVEQAQEGRIALPQFQRNFVWPREEIADLLLSILKGYFIGTFLLLETDRDHTPFGVRPLAGVGKRPEDLRPERLVLDGQQRLTSLHYVLAAPAIPLRWTRHPYRFFLDLRKALENDDDGLVFSRRADRCGDLLDEETQFERWILPFTEVPRWTEWKDRYEDWLFDRDRDEHRRYREERRNRWNELLGMFRGFQVPVIEIPKVHDGDREGITEVCAIFEKLNSTGIRLSVFDLLTARLYRYGIDLHALWEEAVSEHALLKKFSEGSPADYGVLALRTVALLRRQEVKSRSLIHLGPEGFEDDWRTAVAAMEKALKRVTGTEPGGFGAFDSAWLPYRTMLPVLAAVLVAAERAPRPDQAYRDLGCWYWTSVFLERYAGAVESRTYRDAMDLLRRQEEPDFRPEVFLDVRRLILDNERFQLRTVARVNSIYRGVMSLVALRGARDFENNDGIAFHQLEDHHIFPRAFLRERYGLKKGEKVNTILNRTLITARTNRRISRKAPSEYLAEIFPERERSAILESHFIGPEAQKAMEADDYDAFLEARERSILAELRERLDAARE